MKKYIFSILGLLLIISLCSCGQEKSNNNANNITSSDNVQQSTTHEETHPPTSTIEILPEDRVYYIADRKVWYADNENRFVLVFSLWDINEQEVFASADVDIRIENDDGIEVYSNHYALTSSDYITWRYNNGDVKHQATIYINDCELVEGSSNQGKIFFTVYNDGKFSFDESTLTVSHLPEIDYVALCSLKYPDLPDSYSYGYANTVYSTLRVDGISYEFSKRNNRNVNLTIDIEGQRTYDSGSSHRYSGFKWKLYDSDGYVVETGSFLIGNLSLGDRFRGETITIFDIPVGEYRIVFEDDK